VIKRSIFVFLWTIGFFVGGSVATGLLAAAWLHYLMYTGAHPTSEAAYKMVDRLYWLPLVTGPIGLILGIVGFLPGTKRKKRTEQSGG
jgi:hypothetical protein